MVSVDVKQRWIWPWVSVDWLSRASAFALQNEQQWTLSCTGFRLTGCHVHLPLRYRMNSNEHCRALGFGWLVVTCICLCVTEWTAMNTVVHWVSVDWLSRASAFALQNEQQWTLSCTGFRLTGCHVHLPLRYRMNSYEHCRALGFGWLVVTCICLCVTEWTAMNTAVHWVLVDWLSRTSICLCVTEWTAVGTALHRVLADHRAVRTAGWHSPCTRLADHNTDPKSGQQFG